MKKSLKRDHVICGKVIQRITAIAYFWSTHFGGGGKSVGRELYFTAIYCVIVSANLSD